MVERSKEGGDWQRAAQVAASIAGVLLVVPVYLISAEVFGASSAWLAVVLLYLLPFNSHVLADTLSESTFLLFWSWGLWSALRFLRAGRLTWLPLFLLLSVLSYLTRPEGLILPVALLATLLLLGLARASEIPRAARLWSIAILLLGPIALAGPFMVMKGGISTKPSMLRIMGLGRPAPAMAVERERPLEPGQTLAKTTLLATRAMLRAVFGATSLLLLLLAPLGIMASYASPTRRRYWILLGTIISLSALAMIRLHALAGYCTPRHAMVVAWIIIPASAAGLNELARLLATAAAQRRGRQQPSGKLEASIRFGVAATCLALWAPSTFAAIDPGFHGYRLAGEWLAASAQASESTVDPKGFSLFYADRPGFTFATLMQGLHDPSVRWVVAHEALIFGPWDYSKSIRTLVGGRRPVRIFPAAPAHGVSKVYVYDLAQPETRSAGVPEPEPAIRRYAAGDATLGHAQLYTNPR
jgi:4-amino-4-deoxy-L-arabinose transferase-like glycosyltransferase